MALRLVQVTPDIADRTDFAWRRQLQDAPGSLPDTKFVQALKWAKDFASGDHPDKGQAFAYAVVRDDDPCALALVEVSRADPGGSARAWIKLLRVHVAPALDIGTEQEEAAPYDELAEIAATVLADGFQLTLDELPASMMKVWGANPLTTDFLAGIAGAVKPPGGLRFSIRGNWLFVER